jgi:hypothetical protein
MSGQTRSFASVEPHASFTLTSGHPRPQSVHPIVKVAQGDRAGKERTTTAAQLHRNVSAIFLESVLGKFRIGASANRHRRPRDVGWSMVGWAGPEQGCTRLDGGDGGAGRPGALGALTGDDNG